MWFLWENRCLLPFDCGIRVQWYLVSVVSLASSGILENPGPLMLLISQYPDKARKSSPHRYPVLITVLSASIPFTSQCPVCTSPRRGVLLGILGGGVLPGSPNPDPTSNQKMFFSDPVFRPDLWNPYPFSDLALKQKLVRLESKQTNFSNPFQIHIFLFHSYLFGIETINTFTRPRSSLENHTRFQTKMGKVCTRVQTKTAQKNLPKAAHTYVAYLRKYPPGVLVSCSSHEFFN